MSPILNKLQAFPWFKKLRTYFFPIKEVTPELLYQADIDKLSALSADHYVYQDVRRLESVVYNIEDYTFRLTQLLSALHGDTDFPSMVFELKQVKRCHFYLNSKGEYSDVHRLHKQFVEIAIKVLMRHEAVTALNNRPVKLDTAIYRGQTLFNNLRSLITQL